MKLAGILIGAGLAPSPDGITATLPPLSVSVFAPAGREVLRKQLLQYIDDALLHPKQPFPTAESYCFCYTFETRHHFADGSSNDVIFGPGWCLRMVKSPEEAAAVLTEYALGGIGG